MLRYAPMGKLLRRSLPLVLVILSLGGCGDDGESHTPTADASAPTDPRFQAAREACTFTGGAKVTDTLGISEAARANIPIKHVVILMKENRSFDHVLGKLHEQGQPGTDAIPADFQNPTSSAHNKFVAPFRAPTTCWTQDPGHQWASMHLSINNGLMDGFVLNGKLSTTGDGSFVMSYYEKSDIPFYYWLASTFALNDRHFPSVASGTFPNRDYLLLGTSDGVTATGDGYPKPETPTIFDAFDKAGVTWGVYSDGGLLSETLNWDYSHKNTGHFADFISALDGGRLPQVTFVDGIDNVEDEHPTGDMQRGEEWTRNVYEHARASRYWNDMALIWTYDEAGGFFDHVPPPAHVCIARPQDADFFEAGVRVPLVVISPWARTHYVSHVVQDHTSIPRFLETLFDLPALTARDANSDAMLDMFDFQSPQLLTPPAAPEAGSGGCQELVLSLDKPNYLAGDPIQVTFSHGPGTNPRDKIAVYTYPPSGATLPSAEATLLWSYIGGTQAGTTAPATGTVSLDMTKVAAGKGWPLAPGGYIAYYLPNNGYTATASVDFNVH